MKKNIYLFIIISILISNNATSGETATIEQKISSWRKSINKQLSNNKLNISSSIDVKTQEFFDIVDIGIYYLNTIIVMQGSDNSLTIFLPAITKLHAENHFEKNINAYVWDDYLSFHYIPRYLRKSMSVEKQVNFWSYWWNEGRKRTPEIFKCKYEAYQTAKKVAKADDIKQAYTKLQNMGIIILPNLLEKIKNGDHDLIPIFCYLSEQKKLKTAIDCEKWWNANKGKYKDLLDY